MDRGACARVPLVDRAPRVFSTVVKRSTDVETESEMQKRRYYYIYEVREEREWGEIQVSFTFRIMLLY